MNSNEFSVDYLNEFVDKLSKENKTIFLSRQIHLFLASF